MNLALCVNAHGGSHGRLDAESETLIAAPLGSNSHQLETREDGTANAILTPNGGRGGIGVGAVATFDERNVTSKANRTRVEYGAPANTLHESPLGVISAMAVRRLTPRECERLQGFPDDYTSITYKGKPAADGPRYRALGNSMAVPVMRWIGERISIVDSILRATA